VLPPDGFGHIGRIIFGLYMWGEKKEKFQLSELQVFNSQSKLVVDKIRGNKPENARVEVVLEKFEIIVSVSVQVDRLYPVNIIFMVFDAVKAANCLVNISQK
jgi:hypothetical protein